MQSLLTLNELLHLIHNNCNICVNLLLHQKLTLNELLHLIHNNCNICVNLLLHQKLKHQYSLYCGSYKTTMCI